MTTTNERASALSDFELSDSEAFTIALAKLWFMQSECDSDPDESDRDAKGLVCLEYALAVHRMCQIETDFEDVAGPRVVDMIERSKSAGWVPAVRRAIGDLDFEEARAVLTNRDLLAGLLGLVAPRSRAVVLVIELSAFYPWPKGIKFEKAKRRELLDQIAGFLPSMDAAYSREIDQELSRQILKLKIKGLNWGKIALIASGGAVIGFLTGGLAAPAVGGAIGVSMGLSGAAAANAGLALLGGGAIAAGGAGVAGGTLMVSATAAAGAGVFGAGGAAAQDLRSMDVLVDTAKLEVLTKYVLIREKRDPEKARMVAALFEQRMKAAEERQTEVDKALANASSAIERLLEKLTKTEKERDEAMAAAQRLTAEVDALKTEKKQLTDSLKYWHSGERAIAQLAAEA